MKRIVIAWLVVVAFVFACEQSYGAYFRPPAPSSSGTMVYPGAGIAVTDGNEWLASITMGTFTHTYLCTVSITAGLKTLNCDTNPASFQTYNDILASIAALTISTENLPLLTTAAGGIKQGTNAPATDGVTDGNLAKKQVTDGVHSFVNGVPGTDYIAPSTDIYDYDFISIKYMDDGATAPSALAVTGATNKVMTRAFSGSADNDMFFMWKHPYGLDSSIKIQYRVLYYINSGTVPDETANSNAGEGAVWSLAGVTIRSGIDVQDASLGSTVTLTTTMGSVSATWQASHNFAANDWIIPTTANGYIYKVTTDNGSSGGTEPTWPTTIGGTVSDGDLVWTCMGYNAPAQWTMIKSNWSGDVTVTNAAGDKWAVFNFKRLATNAADTYAQALGVLGIEIRYARKLQVQ